jgi:hypothetical protein
MRFKVKDQESARYVPKVGEAFLGNTGTPYLRVELDEVFFPAAKKYKIYALKQNGTVTLWSCETDFDDEKPVDLDIEVRREK